MHFVALLLPIAYS